MILEFPHKRLRAQVIKDYVRGKDVVCFSCGNASSELIYAGVHTLCIGDGFNSLLTPTRWFTQREIAEIFPTFFDATPGHLSMELMLLLAEKYKEFLTTHNLIEGDEYDILCGSGETLVCLKLAFPEKRFNAIYNAKGFEKETKYDSHAPLNQLVKLVANKINI